MAMFVDSNDVLNQCTTIDSSTTKILVQGTDQTMQYITPSQIGAIKVQVVDALPESPDSDTFYFIPVGES